MGWYTVGSTVAKIASSGVRAYLKYDAAKDAEHAMKQAAKRTSALNELNERAMQAQNAETERRLAAQNRTAEGIARARAAASGVALTGSMADYLSFMRDENLKEFEWTQQSGKSKLEALKAAGESDVRALKTKAKAAGKEATGAIIGGVLDTVATGFDAGGWTGDDAWYKQSTSSKWYEA